MRPETEIQVVIDDDWSTLLYHPRPKIVHHEMRRVIQGEQFHQLLERGLALLVEHGACKWLSANRGQGPLTQADSIWAQTVWAPRAIAAGWRYWAVVMPERIIGQMSMTHMIKTYAQKGVTVSTFSEPEAAMKWLARR